MVGCAGMLTYHYLLLSFTIIILRMRLIDLLTVTAGYNGAGFDLSGFKVLSSGSINIPPDSIPTGTTGTFVEPPVEKCVAVDCALLQYTKHCLALSTVFVPLNL